jgi:hypothetical protein
VNHNSVTRLHIDYFMATLGTDEGWNALRNMDSLSWMGEVKKNGFPYVLGWQDITIPPASGKVV